MAAVKSDADKELATAKKRITDINEELAKVKKNKSDVDEELATAKERINDINEELTTAAEKIRDGECLRRKLHDTVMELKGNIRVFCRVRPPLPDEASTDGDSPIISFPVEGKDLRDNWFLLLYQFF